MCIFAELISTIVDKINCELMKFCEACRLARLFLFLSNFFYSVGIEVLSNFFFNTISKWVEINFFTCVACI